MPHPKKKSTRTSKKKRASHFGIDSKAMVSCDACDAKKAPHTACQSCGSYKGNKVLNVENRAARRAKKTLSES